MHTHGGYLVTVVLCLAHFQYYTIVKAYTIIEFKIQNYGIYRVGIYWLTGQKVVMFGRKIRHQGGFFRSCRPQNVKEHTLFWVR